MQIVYISNREGQLNRSLEQVALFMPFVDKALVLCPMTMQSRVTAPAGMQLTMLTDELFSNIFVEQGHWDDHVFRNYFLRRALLARPEVEEEFLLADDDYLPLRPCELNFFKSGGKYQPYYFYDLEKWTPNVTSFDRGMHSTLVLLKHLQLSTWGFAAHMPQLINKSFFAEAARFFEPYASQYPLCEWTTYFNYGLAHYPDRFHLPKVYQTLTWPELPLVWPWYVKPERYAFENYCPGLYERGSIFEDLPVQVGRDNWELVLVEKLQRLQAIEIGRLELPYHPKDPLRKGFFRRILALFIWCLAIIRRRIKS